MHKPLVSVIICTYNYSHFIEEAVESVLNQTLLSDDIEIIVIDDGSTDDTVERLKKYKDRIKYIYKDNGGPTESLNIGIEKATGKIISLLDADDSWHPDKLKEVVSEFKKLDSIDVVYHYITAVDKNNKIIMLEPDPKDKKAPYFKKYQLDDYLKGKLCYSPPTSAVSIKTECLKKLYPLPTEGYLLRMNADVYIRNILPLYAREFALVKKHLSNYRIHSDNIWASGSLIKKTEREIALYKLIVGHIEKRVQVLKYSATLLKKKFLFDIARQEILLFNLQRKPFAAFKRAVFLEEFPTDNKFLFRMFKKIDTILLAILPYTRYKWLLKRYTNSFLFDLVHRL